jgi:hypothetical protein
MAEPTAKDWDELADHLTYAASCARNAARQATAMKVAKDGLEIARKNLNANMDKIAEWRETKS